MLIRLAAEEDMYDVFEWRNDPHTRNMFIRSAPISFSDHETWYRSVIKSSDSIVLIGEIDQQKVGVCRFDDIRGHKSVDVSINMNPKMRNKRLGSPLLMGSILYLRRYCSKSISAQIRKINSRSCRLFSACGFKAVLEDHDLIYMLREH